MNEHSKEPGSGRAARMAGWRCRSAAAGLSLGLALPGCIWAEDLSQAGMDLGRRVFAETCSDCHGKAAEGNNAPDIQGLPRQFTLDALGGIDQMPEIELTPEEADAVAAFVESLPEGAER